MDRNPELARSVTGRPDAWPVWDLIAVAHPLGLTPTDPHRRPRLRDNLSFDHVGAGAGEFRWIHTLEEGRLWEQFVQASQAAEAARSRGPGAGR